MRVSTATGQPLRIYGEILLDVDIPSLRRSYPWTFVVADVTEPILGNDFLAAFELIVDCGAQTLTDSVTSIRSSVPTVFGTTANLVTNYLSHLPAPAKDLFDKYPDLLRPQKAADLQKNPIHTRHTIDTGSAPPTFSSPRPLPPDKLSCQRIILNSPPGRCDPTLEVALGVSFTYGSEDSVSIDRVKPARLPPSAASVSFVGRVPAAPGSSGAATVAQGSPQDNSTAATTATSSSDNRIGKPTRRVRFTDPSPSVGTRPSSRSDPSRGPLVWAAGCRRGGVLRGGTAPLFGGSICSVIGVGI